MFLLFVWKFRADGHSTVSEHVCPLFLPLGSLGRSLSNRSESELRTSPGCTVRLENIDCWICFIFFLSCTVKLLTYVLLCRPWQTQSELCSAVYQCLVSGPGLSGFVSSVAASSYCFWHLSHVMPLTQSVLCSFSSLMPGHTGFWPQGNGHP